MKKKIAIVFTVVLVAFLALRFSFPVVNDVETGKSEAYPELKPVLWKGSYSAVFWVSARTAKAMPLWTLTNVQLSDGVIQAEARTPTMGFVDDVWIKVEQTSQGIKVSMRSKSRVGKSDFGANARRIQEYLARLQRSLKAQDLVGASSRQRVGVADTE